MTKLVQVKRSQMRHLAVAVWMLFIVTVVSTTSQVACTHAPPTLSPVAQQQFNNTRVVKALDLIRDTAIDANAQVPPLMSTNATRIVVTFHRSALVTINASTSGWKATVLQSLDELVKDKALLPTEVQRITPYVALAKTLIGAL
jgi:hypothetical protein